MGTSTLLPLLLAPVRGSANLEYFVAAACGVPALMLLFVFEAPEKRQAEAPASGSDASAANSGSLGVWLLAVIACMAQALLQGSNSALIQYLVTFGQRQIHLPRNSASMLVTLLQGGVMCGSLLAARFQAQFSLLNLACVQLFLVCSLVASWIAHAHVSKLAFVVVALYGVVSGPTLGYNNALFNTYTKPTGKHGRHQSRNQRRCRPCPVRCRIAYAVLWQSYFIVDGPLRQLYSLPRHFNPLARGAVVQWRSRCQGHKAWRSPLDKRWRVAVDM